MLRIATRLFWWKKSRFTFLPTAAKSNSWRFFIFKSKPRHPPPDSCLKSCGIRVKQNGDPLPTPHPPPPRHDEILKRPRRNSEYGAGEIIRQIELILLCEQDRQREKKLKFCQPAFLSTWWQKDFVSQVFCQPCRIIIFPASFLSTLWQNKFANLLLFNLVAKELC
jgi:hypothetical protein